MDSTRYFILRRLHSLSGVLPIGAFLLFHFFENASARRGAAAFDATVVKISEMPYLYVVEIFGLLAPILFHSIFGLMIASHATHPTAIRSATLPFNRTWHYVMQRITGVVALFYIGYHVMSTRMWALFVKGDHITFADMQAKLAEPFAFWVYVAGIVAITYHFSNGLGSFSITWGIVRKERAMRALAYGTQGLFVVLCLVGLDILSSFRVEHGFIAQLMTRIFG